MLQAFAKQEALRKEHNWCTAVEMAQTRGISYEAMRSQLSYHGVRRPAVCRYAERVGLVAKLWCNGLPEEIAEFLDVPERRVELDAIALGYRQLSLWYANEYRVKHEPKAHGMRVVHRASKAVPAVPKYVQGSLFPSPINDQQRAA